MGVAHRNGDGRVGIRDDLPAHEAFGGVHRDGAHGALAQVLRHLENEALAVVVAFQRVENLGQVVVELNVDDGGR